MRRRWPRRMLVGANILVAMGLIVAAGAFGYVQWRFGQIRTVGLGSLSGSENVGSPFTLLVVGSDTRALADGNAFGGAAATPGHRSDTILLIRAVPATKTLAIMSIPRDLWVPIKGMGHSRINSAFDTGANLLISTIQSDLGIPINHYVEINFDSFRQITDAVGGVKVYFPTPARDVYSGLNIGQPGCVNLTGDQALGFARSRHYQYYQDGYWHTQGLSDLARIQRQQYFVKKMIAKAQSQFTDPVALNGIIAGVTKNLTVDSGFSTSLMLNLAKTFRHVDVGSIHNETLPTYNETISGQEVLGLQQPQASQMIAAFNSLGNTPPPQSGTTTATTSPAAPATSVAPSSVSVEVANGSGVTGQAGQAASQLKALGYKTAINPSPSGPYSSTLIRYSPDSAAAAQQLSHQVGGPVTLQEDQALAPTPYNVEVVTGSGFTGITGSAGASGSSGGSGSQGAPTTAAAPATTVPPTTSTTYLLPGASGPVPAC